jgi:hypothetical protein
MATSKVWCRALMREVLTGKDFSSNYDFAFKHSGDASTVMNAVDGNDLLMYPWDHVGNSHYPAGGNPYRPTPTGIYTTFVHEFTLDHPGFRPGVVESAEMVFEFRGEAWWNGVEVGMWDAYWDYPPYVGFPAGGHGWLDLEIRSWNPSTAEGGGYVYAGVYVGGNVWQERRDPVPQGVINWLNSAAGDLFWLEGKTHPKDAQGYWGQKAYWPEDDPRVIVGIGSTCPPNQHMGDKDKTWLRLTGYTGGENDGTDGWQRSTLEVGKWGVEFTIVGLDADQPFSTAAPPPLRADAGLGRPTLWS